jgi:hypothetical protein
MVASHHAGEAGHGHMTAHAGRGLWVRFMVTVGTDEPHPLGMTWHARAVRVFLMPEPAA